MQTPALIVQVADKQPGRQTANMNRRTKEAYARLHSYSCQPRARSKGAFVLSTHQIIRGFFIAPRVAARVRVYVHERWAQTYALFEQENNHDRPA